jgi:hypothetical protein
MRFFAAVVAAAVVVAAPAASAAPSRTTILGVVWYDGRTTAVAKLDAMTLEPVAQSAIVKGPASFRTLSPDGRRAIFGVDEGGTLMRIVDLDTLSWGATLSPAGGNGAAILWSQPNQIVALGYGPVAAISIIDASTGAGRIPRVVSGLVITAVVAPHAIVAIVGAEGKIAHPRLVVVDENGSVKSRALRQIKAGTRVVSQQPFRMRTKVPGLAVDPDGARAVIVPAVGPILDVDLRTLAVAPHTLAVRTLAAHTKAIEGTDRRAEWFGGYVTVTGTNYTTPESSQPIGLWAIDPRDWTVRLVDAEVGATVFSHGRLVALKTLIDDTHTFAGIEATTYDGKLQRLHTLVAHGNAWISAVTADRIYVALEWAKRFEIVDAATGAVIAPSVAPSHPTSIVGDS